MVNILIMVGVGVFIGEVLRQLDRPKPLNRKPSLLSKTEIRYMDIEPRWKR